MPLRKRSFKKRSYKKRPYRRRKFSTPWRRRRRISNAFAKSKTIVPNRRLIEMKYQESISITAPGAGFSTFLLRANSVYDPNQSGVGESAMGFDQMMALYEHYTVLSCKINVEFFNITTGVPCVIGVEVVPSTTVSAALDDFMEGPRSKWTVTQFLPIQKDKITHKVSLKKFLGKKSILDEDDCQGGITSNPVEQVYFALWTASLDGATSIPTATTCNVFMNFRVMFTEPKPVIGS